MLYKGSMNVLSNELEKPRQLFKPKNKNPGIYFDSSDENTTESYVSLDGCNDNIGDKSCIMK